MEIPGEEKEKGSERMCKEILAENFPNLQRKMTFRSMRLKETQAG